MISYFFLHGDSHQGKPASETLQDLLMINISGKNQLISFFFDDDSYQRKLLSQTTTFGWVRRTMSQVLSN